MPLESAIERSHRWMVECAALVDGVTFETTNRLRVAVSLLHLCIEHQTGIHTLVDHGVIGSAFALFRPQFESYVRGVWYHRCATEEHVTSFLVGTEPPRIAVLIQALEALPAFDAGSLSAMKKETWRNLNDFTHGGMVQVKARNSRDEVASNYKHEHIAGLLESSATFSLLGAVGIAAAVNSDSLALELESAFKRVYERVA